MRAPARWRMAARGVDVNGGGTAELPNPVVTGTVLASAPMTATEWTACSGSTALSSLSSTADRSAACSANAAWSAEAFSLW